MRIHNSISSYRFFLTVFKHKLLETKIFIIKKITIHLKKSNLEKLLYLSNTRSKANFFIRNV